MPSQVVNGALLMCDMGVAPSSLVVLPVTGVTCSENPAATVMDFVPMENIQPFGMCMSPANPEVASATAAAMGVLTPMPCIPATASPWVPGGITVTIGEMTALDNVSMCMCNWLGTITITFAGQVQTSIP